MQQATVELAQQSAPTAAGAPERPVPVTRTVLAVEDSKVEQQRLVAMLQGFGYRVITADDGAQALAILRETPVSVVLSDWRMPELNGIELCRELRADVALGEPYVILVTGMGNKMDLVAGMDAGADDFIAKPYNGEELRVRVQAGVRLVEARAEVERRSEELAAALSREAAAGERIRDDLALAARMQRALLPEGGRPFPGVEVGALFQAAAGVAGDGYGFFRLDERHLGFFLVDVAGHGVAAAMMSFTVSRFLAPESGAVELRREAGDAHADSSLPPGIVPPHRVVAALDARLSDRGDSGSYFTMVYGVLDVETGRGELCQAGHPHPLRVSAAGKVVRLGNGGFPVGLLDGAAYRSVAFELGRGERLYLYSDGVTDCRSASGEPFGEPRLERLLGKLRGLPTQKAVAVGDEALSRWRGNAEVQDDISLLAIERLTAPARERA